MACGSKNISPHKEEWVQLFNKKDLSDWRVKIRSYELNSDFGNTFRVEDSVLKVSYVMLLWSSAFSHHHSNK